MNKVKLIAIAAAVLVAVLMFFFLNSLSESGGPKNEVVTAAVNIPANTEISAEMLVVSEMSKDSIHPDAVSDIASIIGKVPSSDIISGEQILSAKLNAPGESGNKTLAYAIEPGMRAITVAVGETSGLAGMLKPQDWVDIIAQFESTGANGVPATFYSTMVAENVKVLAVDSVMAKSGKQSTEEGIVSPYTSITLQVTPQQAMKLGMTEYQGVLRAILRSPLDDKLTNQPSVTFESVVVK